MINISYNITLLSNSLDNKIISNCLVTYLLVLPFDVLMSVSLQLLGDSSVSTPWWSSGLAVVGSRAGVVSVGLKAVQFEVFLAVAANEYAREQSHAGNDQKLQQGTPGEDVVQRGDLGQDGARAHTYEVIWDQACKRYVK